MALIGGATHVIQWLVQRVANPRGGANPIKPVVVRIAVCRSEEGRGGKGGRFRGAPYNLKKKKHRRTRGISYAIRTRARLRNAQACTGPSDPHPPPVIAH